MGVFDSVPLFSTYRCQIEFRDKLMGGVPRRADLVEAWIRTTTGVEDEEERKQMVARTLRERGVDFSEGASYEEMLEASKDMAVEKMAVGFKRGENGLYVESRIIKSMLKENTNILYAGEKWGQTRKGPKSFLAERVFVNPDKVWLGVSEPTGIELFIGHTSGPKGPQSNLTYYEYVVRPVLTFEILVTRDAVESMVWPQLWRQAQENGMGALRSQGFGRFDVIKWDVVK